MIGKIRYLRVMANLGREINGNRTLLAATPSGHMAEYEAWLTAAKKDELIDGAAALAAALFRGVAANAKWQRDVRLHVQTCVELARQEMVRRGLLRPSATDGV